MMEILGTVTLVMRTLRRCGQYGHQKQKHVGISERAKGEKMSDDQEAGIV